MKQDFLKESLKKLSENPHEESFGGSIGEIYEWKTILRESF